MSMATLEKAILSEAQAVLNNPKLRKKDIAEWSTGDIGAEDGEVVVRCPDIGVNVAVSKKFDKRK